jgi:hypothetical protein
MEMKRYRFKAQIQPGIGGGAGVMFPYDVQQEFGARGEHSRQGHVRWRAALGLADTRAR